MHSQTETLENCKKRLIFRSWHRGTREMDLIMGRFADAHVPSLTFDQISAYERLLEVQDPDLYDWYTGKTPVPESENSDVARMFLSFKLEAIE